MKPRLRFLAFDIELLWLSSRTHTGYFLPVLLTECSLTMDGMFEDRSHEDVGFMPELKSRSLKPSISRARVWSRLLNEKPHCGVCFQLGFCLRTCVHVKSLEVPLAKYRTS